jgi:hypothetical protein
MAVKYTNNAVSLTTNTLGLTDTTLVISVSDAVKFPALAVGEWFPITLVNASSEMEIMRCTARTGNSFTVVRAQEGTTARNFPIGSNVSLNVTKALLDDLKSSTLADAAAAALIATASAIDSTGMVVPVVDRAAMLAVDTAKRKTALLVEQGRGGAFAFETGDRTAEVTADPNQGVYVSSAPLLGAWKRIETRKVSPKMFGAVRGTPGNYDPLNPTLLSSKAAIQACWTWAAANKAKVIMDDEFHGGGHLEMPSFLHCEWESGAFTYQTEKSVFGGFIMNRSVNSAVSKYRQSVILENPQVDGRFALAPRRYTVSATTNATVFTLDGSAPAIDDALNGLVVQFIDGTAGINGLSTGLILDYVGATRQVTLFAASNITPVPGTICDVGWNDLGIAFGCYDSVIDGFHIRNYPFLGHVPYVNGAKGINIEQGAYGLSISRGLLENCGHGIYVQGISFESISNPEFIRDYPSSGTAAITNIGPNTLRLPVGASAVSDLYRGYVCYFYPTGDLNFEATHWRKIINYDGATKELTFEFGTPLGITTAWTVVIARPKRNSDIIYSDIRLKNCGTVMTVLGGEPFHDPEPFDNKTIITNVVADNCGYAPFRVVGSAAVKQKSGLIHLTGAANVHISNVNMHNEKFFPNDHPGWSGIAPTMLGYGLSGPVGAIIWGTARNANLHNISYHGNCDEMIHLARGQAVGRDGTPTGALRMNIKGLHHYGTCNVVFATGQNAPTSPNLTGLWEDITPGTVTTGFTDGSGLGYENVEIELVDHLTNKSVRGLMADLNRYNSFATAGALLGNQNILGQTFAAQQFKSAEFLVADDAVVLIPAPSFFNPGQELTSLVVGCNLFGASCFIDVRAAPVLASCYAVKQSPVNALSNNVTVQTGVLSGTTGTDGTLNISISTNNFLYIENRVGSPQTVSLTFLR